MCRTWFRITGDLFVDSALFLCLCGMLWYSLICVVCVFFRSYFCIHDYVSVAVHFLLTFRCSFHFFLLATFYEHILFSFSFYKTELSELSSMRIFLSIALLTVKQWKKGAFFVQGVCMIYMYVIIRFCVCFLFTVLRIESSRYMGKGLALDFVIFPWMQQYISRIWELFKCGGNPSFGLLFLGWGMEKYFEKRLLWHAVSLTFMRETTILRANIVESVVKLIYYWCALS